MPNQSSQRPKRSPVPALAALAVLAVTLAIAARFAPWEVAIGNLVLRSQRGMGASFPAPVTGQLVEVAHHVGATDPTAPRPRNVILIIGDGMGVGQVSAASVILHGPDGRLAMESAPVTGLMKTVAGDRLVTDSAASSTAMATGFKAPKKAISVLADGRAPVTLFEAARSAGLSTGVVTTSGLVDATPAGFAAHQPTRELYAEILDDMLASGTDVLVGGDWSAYPKASRNQAYQDRVRNIDSLAAAAGYRLARTLDELDRAEGRVIGWFPPRGRGGDAHGPELERTAVVAAERLAASGDGFVLLVESEITDGMGHDNDIAGLAAAVEELDAAVAAVLDWSARRGDTLVVVTADHDTGGLAIVDGTYLEGVADVRWTTDGHTAQWVPVFAFGPGAAGFSGVSDNSDLGILIAALLGLHDFPALRP